MKQVWSVGRVASWEGFCLPCGRDDRPLVLTRSGASGLRAWLAGVGDEERTLLLTCRVCGEWQVVPLREDDDPEVVVEAVVEAAPTSVAVRLPRQRTAAGTRTVVVLPVLAPLPLRTPAPVADAADPVAVAAAHAVLSAARVGQPRTTASRSAGRPASTGRRRGHRRGHRRGPTPRRPDRTARKARTHVVPVAAATSIVLPHDLLTRGHSVLVAAG